LAAVEHLNLTLDLISVAFGNEYELKSMEIDKANR